MRIRGGLQNRFHRWFSSSFTIQEMISQTSLRLKSNCIQNPFLEARVLVRHAHAPIKTTESLLLDSNLPVT